MAKFDFHDSTLEIIPASHYYVTDGSDTNEFGYEIIIYKDKKQQAYPLGQGGSYLDSFGVEILDCMISQACFNAISKQKEQHLSDLFYGGFDLSIMPNGENWKIQLELNPYYLEHEFGVEFEFNITETALYAFARTLRLEEAAIIAKVKKVFDPDHPSSSHL